MKINFSSCAKVAIVISLIWFFAPFILISSWGDSVTITGTKLIINLDNPDFKTNTWLILAFVSEVIAFFLLCGDYISGDWLSMLSALMPLCSVIFLIVFRTTFTTYYQESNDLKFWIETCEFKTQWGYILNLICMIIATIFSALNALEVNGFDINKPLLAPSYSNPSNNCPSALTAIANESTVKQQRKEGYWECLCGRLNPPYTTGCACGLSVSEINRKKAEMEKAKKIEDERRKVEQKQSEKAENEKKMAENVMNEKNNIALLKEYKDLLDNGIISQEEFDLKKHELLKL